MTDTLTTLIGKVQGILGDAAGTYFGTPLCTAAIRQALHAWNLRVPTYAAVTITAVTDQYEYELHDEDPDALEIVDVLRQGVSANERDISLDFDDYWEDNRLFFRLRTPETSDKTIIVRYKLANTIEGLDSATESTLASFDDQAMVDGGAFFAIIARGISRVETINLSQGQSQNYSDLAPILASAFSAHLAAAALRRAPVSEPDGRRWKDKYDAPSWHMEG